MEYLDAFDRIRISKHNIQYGGITTDKNETMYVLNFAREFLDKVREKWAILDENMEDEISLNA